MNSLELLIRGLTRLPGIGRKSASRMAYYLLESDRAYAETLASAILHMKETVKTCPECGSYTEEVPCSTCSDHDRNRSLICVVEHAQDALVLEGTREYDGLFHVLGGVISPIDGVGPQDLRIGKLLERVRREGVKEVIIATNPTVEGDTTALYIARLMKDQDVRVSRLALGLPVGGDLEYADRLTVARSLRGRTLLSE